MSKLSIRKIAELSGVSVATVSRVINNNGRFSEETKKKVLDVINETGYQTNYSAKSLRMNKSFTIGIIVPDITNYFFAKLIEILEKLLFEVGYSVIICNTARDLNKEIEYLKVLNSKGVDGLIIISGDSSFKVSENNGRNIPYICIDREPEVLSETIFISSDHYTGAILATNYLFEKKCHHPIFLSYPRESGTNSKRLQGFIKSLNDHDIKYNLTNHTFNLDPNNQNSLEEFKKFLIDNPEIDGIFAVNDNMAYIFLDFLKSNNIVHTYKLVGFDNTPGTRFTNPPFSSIEQDIPKVAKISVRKLLGLMKNKSDLGKVEKIPVKLIEH